MTLPTLYSLTSLGQTQTWSIEFSGGKFRTTEGIKGGAMTVSEWTVCEGKNLGKKNETSPEVQAEKEARAKWKKKTESGYWESEADIHKTKFFEPMLAHKWADRSDTKPTPEDLEESKKIVQFHVFDMFMRENPKATFSHRYAAYNILCQKGGEPYKAGFRAVRQKLVQSFEEAKEYFAEAIERGYRARLRRMICKLPDGRTFEANSRGDEAYYIDLLKNKKDYIGKPATIRYQNLTPDGKPRFGVCVSVRTYE